MKDGHKILSNGLEAAHNTDGYDLSTTTNVSVAPAHFGHDTL
jgi:hypothetical protein